MITVDHNSPDNKTIYAPILISIIPGLNIMITPINPIIKAKILII